MSVRQYLTRPLFLCLAVLLSGAGIRAAQTPNASEAVFQHLDHSVSWFRAVANLVQSTPALNAAPARDSLRQQSVAALQSAFDYARAQSAALGSEKESNQGSPGSTTSAKPLQQAYDTATARIAAAEAKKKDLADQMERARGKKRAELLAQQDAIDADLKLNHDLQAMLKRLLDFMSSSEDNGGLAGTLGRINQLEQSVPELQQDANKASPAGNAQQFHADSAGILSLGIEIFTLMRARVQLDQQVKTTNELMNEAAQMRAPLRSRLRALLAQSAQFSNQSAGSTAADRARIDTELSNLEQQFSATANILVPLRKEAFLLEGARSSMTDWSAALEREYLTALRYLLLRFAEIAVLLVLVLVLSDIWRRLTFRYVRDSRLRRQMLLIRRIVVGFTVTLVLILSFITEFGSVATFAGFLTAGIAVALQNLILSVVAYFFLIGRYGVRVGDRVTISGVTGEVVEVGLVRLYMMELAGAGTDLRPTGRIVVYSNSVLFQPSALFKQLPGTEYAWHTVSITLASDVDLNAAESRIMTAVTQVYNQYKDAIHRQHKTFEQSVNLQVAEPEPERRVQYTDAGLEVSVRYPVIIGQASATDDQIMKTLLETVNREPKVHFAASPRIQTAI